MSRAAQPPPSRRSGGRQQRDSSFEQQHDSHRAHAPASNQYAQQIYVAPSGSHQQFEQHQQSSHSSHQQQQHQHAQHASQPRQTFLHDSQPVWTPHGSEVYPAQQPQGWAIAAASSAASTPAALYTPSHPANGAAAQHAQYPLVSPPARVSDPARRNGHHHSSAASSHSQSHSQHSRSRSPPRPTSPGSPYDKHRKLSTGRRCCVPLRVWWAGRSGLVRVCIVALALLAVCLLVWALDATQPTTQPNWEVKGWLKPPFPGPSRVAVATSDSLGAMPSQTQTLLVRLRKSLKRFGREVGLLPARAPRKLGEFDAGGARGRCPLPEGTPELVTLGTVAPLKHAPLMSHLLSRSGFNKFLSNQAESLRTERTAAAIAASNAGAPAASQPKWADNPWQADAVLSSRLDAITLFTVVPDSLSLASASSPARLAARRSQLALHLLALSSWVELVSPQKIHVFVMDPESCLGLVGHDGSELGRAEAIGAAAAQSSKANRLAPVHCHVLPAHCIHSKFRRAFMSCVWDQAHAAAVEEGIRRQADVQTERTEALRTLRDSRPVSEGGEGGPALLDASGAPVRFSPEMESQLERSIASLSSESVEQEVMLYMAPTSLFDMQLLTALARLMQDSLVAQSAWRSSAAAANAAAGKPHLGTDVSGALIPDEGHFFAVGKRMDLVLSQKALDPFVPSSAAAGSAAAASPAQMFHAPSAAFDASVEGFLESVWKRAYISPSPDPSTPTPQSLAIHSGFGIDFMALRASTYTALAQDHAQTVQAEQQGAEDAEDESATDARERLSPAEEMLRARMGIYSRAVADLSPVDFEFLLSSAPADKLSPSSSGFFPPFLAGLFRWANWLVSKLVLQRSPFAVKVTDLSASVSLLHLEMEEDPSAAGGVDAEQEARDKLGARYNEVLVRAWSGNAYRIGSVDSAPWLSTGSCALDRMHAPLPASPSAVIDPQSQASMMSPSLAAPLCGIVPRPAGNYSSLFFFTKHASAYPAPSGYLIILTVNSGYISLALNWLCWARRIAFENYILLAEDQQSARVFRALGAPVIVPASAAEDLPPSDYGSVEFQKTMSFRTEFLLDVLLAGFHFVTADMDALWFGNPIEHFPVTADLSGQTHKQTKISGGFVVVRSTAYGRFFWQRVIECQRMNAAFLADTAAHPKGSYEPSLYTEQYCINELSIALEKKQAAMVPPPALPFKRILLDALEFPDGRSFFTQHLSQLSATVPVVIHNNWVLGTEGKFKRMRDWNMISIAGPDTDGAAKGKDGLQKAMELGRRTNPGRDVAVCVPEVTLPRSTTLPARFLPAASGSPTQQQSSPPAHPFHMHIRLFLSASASDGVDQGSAEFANLQRAVQSLIDTDWKSARTADGSVPVDPAVHVEIMVDHFAAAEDVSAELHAASLAEFEGLKTALKAVRKGWVDAFGEPGSAQNRNRFVLEIKRPTDPSAASSAAKKRVGPLGLWILPWPKLFGSAEHAESEEEAEGAAIKDRHHDLSLYLQDSVYLSRHWFTVAHAALSRFLLSPSDSEVDPRVYGLSLLDAHEIYGETAEQRYDPLDARRTQKHFEAQPFFNASTGVLRRVREKAAMMAQSSTAATKGADNDGRLLLPQSFLQSRYFAFQGLATPGALLWLPGHFADFAAFIAGQHIPDTYSSEATPTPVVSDGAVVQPRGTKCVPTLWSNHAILSKPAAETWTEWINRWAFLRGFYALHARSTLVRITQGLTPRDLQAAKEGRASPRLRAKDTGARHAVAVTSEQAKSGEVTLIDKLSPFDLLLPTPSAAASASPSAAASSSSFFPVFDFHFRRVDLPSTLSARPLLYPSATSSVTGAPIEGLPLEACYTLDRRSSALETLAAAEAAALEAERARKRAENEAKKQSKKAEEDAKKKAAAAPAKAKKSAAEQKKHSPSGSDAKAKGTSKPSGGSAKTDKKKAATAGSDKKKKKSEADKKKAAAEAEKKKKAAAAAAAAAKKKAEEEDE